MPEIDEEDDERIQRAVTNARERVEKIDQVPSVQVLPNDSEMDMGEFA